MIARRLSPFALVAAALVTLGTSVARAECTISNPAPTTTLPVVVSDGDGERFVFSASADCVTLEFTSGAFSATPVRGPRPGPGPHTYHVNLGFPVWKSLVDRRDTTFEWTVTGTTIDGVVTAVTTTNQLDSDHDGWTRSEGDVGACDYETAARPDRSEVCDGFDQDCNGLIDDIVWFRDADHDGYGDLSDWVVASCDTVPGFVTRDDGDCNDGNAAINPGAREICDDVDEDCDGFASCNVPLSRADAQYTGEASGDYAGYSVAGAGDVNADGYADILVGANFNSDGGRHAGEAYLVLGGPFPTSSSLSAADTQYTGEAPGDAAGNFVAGAGDVDGDGYSDVLVSALGPGYEGVSYLVLGSPAPASASLAAADVEYTGVAPGDGAGLAAGASDVDGDGYGDILVGAGGDDDAGSDAGAVYLLLGSTSGTAPSLSAADAKYTGEAMTDVARTVAGAGDVNGDGYADALIGAYHNDAGGFDAGAAYVVLGGTSPSSASLSTADMKYTGEGFRDEAGRLLAAAGDVDGDGYGDILIGSLGSTTYLVLGRDSSPASQSLSVADAKYTAEVVGPRSGSVFSLAGAGDVDSDGYGDVLVAAGDPVLRHGYAVGYLVLGDPSPASTSLAGAHVEYNELLADGAVRVAGAGDVNGDGYDDVLLGQFFNSDAASDAGAVFLMLDGGF
jgi:hypothetical protein